MLGEIHLVINCLPRRMCLLVLVLAKIFSLSVLHVRMCMRSVHCKSPHGDHSGHCDASMPCVRLARKQNCNMFSTMKILFGAITLLRYKKKPSCGGLSTFRQKMT